MSGNFSGFMGRRPDEVLAFPIEVSDFDARLEYIGNVLGRAVIDAWCSTYREATEATSAGPLSIFLRDIVIEGRVEVLRAVLRHQQRARQPVPRHIKRRPGRRPGDGAYWDDPLIDEMHQLIKNRKVKSVWHAASMVATRAKGAGTLRSTIARHARKYRRKYPRC